MADIVVNHREGYSSWGDFANPTLNVVKGSNYKAICSDDEGFTRLLTNGKKLNKIGLEKYFDTVLIAKNNDGKYVFETTSPNSTARVPMGCYEGEQYIDNDLYEIIKELKEF